MGQLLGPTVQAPVTSRLQFAPPEEDEEADEERWHADSDLDWEGEESEGGEQALLCTSCIAITGARPCMTPSPLF
jgi:hypothetical protein